MDALTLDPSSTALVLIDLQYGIVGMNLAPRSGTDVVSKAAQLAGAFRAIKSLVVLVNVTNLPDGRDALQPLADAVPAPGGAKADNWATIVAELDAQPDDLRITKRQWGAFYGTELDLQLRRRGIKTIVMAGLSTNVGVESTARDAFERAYEQVFVEDAMGSPSAEAHANTVKYTFPRIGRTRTTQEVLAAMKATA